MFTNFKCQKCKICQSDITFYLQNPKINIYKLGVMPLYSRVESKLPTRDATLRECRLKTEHNER